MGRIKITGLLVKARTEAKRRRVIHKSDFKRKIPPKENSFPQLQQNNTGIKGLFDQARAAIDHIGDDGGELDVEEDSRVKLRRNKVTQRREMRFDPFYRYR
jgi:hypothetical protein